MPPIYAKLKLRQKLGLILLITLLGLVVTLSVFYQGLKSGLIQEKKNHAQLMSETGVALVQHFYSLSLTSDNPDALKQSALDALESMNFGDEGYYWVNSSEGLALMHPYAKELVDKQIDEIQDAEGKFLFREFMEVARDGGGIVQYYWSKPSSQSISEFKKMSYVSYFEPWGWIIGTGIYIDDMEEEINRYAIKALAFVLLFTALFLLTEVYFLRNLVHQLNLHAIRDPTTQLYTRRHLTESGPELLSKANRNEHLFLSVIFMDIDHFKVVNDTYGHGTGDEVIAFIGECIRALSRADDIAFRYGGEEFLILSLSENPDTAKLLVERIRQYVAAKIFTRGDDHFSITISGGIARHKKDETLESTISRADAYLYEAKETGRDKVISKDAPL